MHKCHLFIIILLNQLHCSKYSLCHIVHTPCLLQNLGNSYFAVYNVIFSKMTTCFNLAIGSLINLFISFSNMIQSSPISLTRVLFYFVIEYYSILLLSTILFYGCTTIHLSIQILRDCFQVLKTE